MILLTFELKEIINDNQEKFKKFANSPSILTSYVENDLNNRWQDSIAYDQLKPLYTRIANNIILIKDEKLCLNA
jgi:hypothetical protein